jgi:hypothetical protein
MTEKEKRKEREGTMSIWVFVGIVAVWFLLQAYILPKFGIST